MLNPILYNENNNYNPTELLTQIHSDLSVLTISQMYEKYKGILNPYELSGILIQHVSVECSKQVISIRVNKRNSQ